MSHEDVEGKTTLRFEAIMSKTEIKLKDTCWMQFAIGMIPLGFATILFSIAVYVLHLAGLI